MEKLYVILDKKISTGEVSVRFQSYDFGLAVDVAGRTIEGHIFKMVEF